ncbi:MAG: PilW family protein [Candidatus Zixiibacteriota bacterium]
MRKVFNKSGFTLLEVLISLFLTAIIAAAGFEFFVTMHNQRQVQEDISDMQQSSRNSLQDIAKVLRMAGYKVGGHVPYHISGDSLYVFYNETQPVDTVLFYVEDYADGDIGSPLGIAPEGLQPRRLMKKQNSGSAAVFADYIRYMLFNVVDTNTIDVTLITQASQPDESYTGNYGYRLYVATERVNLRNVEL